MRSRICLYAVAPFLALLATPAASEVLAAKTVQLGGLDLVREADAQRVARRISRAALEVCGGGRGHIAAVTRAAQRSECWRDATRRASGELGSPKVASALAALPQ